jgi:hypothetical protein
MKKLILGIFSLACVVPSAFCAVVVVDNAWINNPANKSNGALIFRSASDTYVFEVDYEAPGTAVIVRASNITIDLNGHTVRFGSNNALGVMGVNMSGTYHDEISLGNDAKNYTLPTINGRVENLTVKNGSIEWNGTSGRWAACIGSVYGGSPLTVDNMRLLVGGADGWAVNTKGLSLNLTNTFAISTTNETENRHQGPGLIRGGRVIAHHNILVGGNSSITAGSGSDVHHNLLRHSGYATNGYGVFTYRNADTKTYNNIIVPTNGRGILYNAGTGHQAYDNLIVVHERPNTEFGESLNPPGVRIRYDANNINVYGNRILAIGGGENTAGSGLYLSDASGMSNYIHDNEFRAILTSPANITTYANGITLEAQQAADQIENNVIASNNYLIRLTGYDGSVNMSLPLRKNTLRWIAGDETVAWLTTAMNEAKYQFTYPATNLYVNTTVLEQIKSEALRETQQLIGGISNNMQRATFFTGYWTLNSSIRLVDFGAGPSVSFETDGVKHFGGSGSTDIAFGRTLVVQAKDSSGAPLQNKTMRIRDNTGIVYSTTTDQSGITRIDLYDYSLFDPASNGATLSKLLRTTHEALIEGYDPVSVSVETPRNLPDPVELIFSSGGFSDSEAPVFSGVSPAAGSEDWALNTAISATVVDSYPGVNQNSIVLTVNGAAVVPRLTQVNGGYRIAYSAPNGLGYGQTYSVSIRAADSHGNSAQQNFQFSTEMAPSHSNTLWKAKDVLSDQSWSNSESANSVRLLISGATLAKNSSRLVLEFKGRTGGSYQIKGVSIAEADLSECPGCIVDTTWTKVHFDGKTEAQWGDPVTILPHEFKLSDPVNFRISENKSYFVTFRIVTPSVLLVPSSSVSDWKELYYYLKDEYARMDWTDAQVASDFHALSRIYSLDPDLSSGEGDTSVNISDVSFKNAFNPTVDPVLEIPCKSNVRILTRQGDLIRDLSCSGGVVLWDGRNSSGGLVSAGVYILKENSRPGRKVVVLK